MSFALLLMKTIVGERPSSATNVHLGRNRKTVMMPIEARICDSCLIKTAKAAVFKHYIATPRRGVASSHSPVRPLF